MASETGSIVAKGGFRVSGGRRGVTRRAAATATLGYRNRQARAIAIAIAHDNGAPLRAHRRDDVTARTPGAFRSLRVVIAGLDPAIHPMNRIHLMDARVTPRMTIQSS
jgi:hypothetical protein